MRSALTVPLDRDSKLAAPQVLTLVHLGGEEREVEIVGIWQTKVQVRWGNLGGVYSLDLRKNVLVGTRNQWRAKDIEAAKSYYRKRRALQDAQKT